jgi:bifunctional UDP-N-acetylglucosamine pyrophosphorylase/glucosamine-1-phosphate N-acetyltransferase
VTFADMPLLRTETLQKLVELHQSSGSVLTMSSIVGDVPRGFGRIVRDAAGNINAIVEEAVATPEQLAIREYNVSAYCFNAQWLWAALPRIKPSPKGEYYLTDLVEIAVKEGLTIRSLVLDDPTEGMGINNRVHLAEATAAMRFRINQELMLSGVTLVDPAMTYIEPGVQVGKDTVIWPNTYLHGNTVIGENCEIGPNTIIFDSKVGNQCKLFESTIEYAEIENNVSMGPFCHLRKGAHLADGVHMGNFGEVKDSYLGPGVKMGHFSYIGNARIEQNVNIGAGTITCNYDGVSKNLTEIGENAFIGSDTMLVAPVKIGKNAQTGAGSVVTKDVEDNTIVVGVPAHVIKRMEKSDRR